MNLERRHEHAGRSSKDLLDAKKVIGKIGLKSGDTFLDAGCGEGYFSIAASEVVGNAGRVYAVDIDEESVAILKTKIAGKNVEAITADITKSTPLENQSIAVCLIANLLHGFVVNKEVGSSMKEIFRILKTGAILAIIDFKKIDDSPGPPVSIRLTPEEVEEIISPHGFKINRNLEAGPYHYLIMFTKQ